MTATLVLVALGLAALAWPARYDPAIRWREWFEKWW
jgi:hypothetical protein